MAQIKNLEGEVVFERDLSIKDTLERAVLERVDLGFAYLRGLDLSGISLFEARLVNANLREANLSGSNLSYADLSDADLSGADLRDANLTEARLSNVNLNGANLEGTKLPIYTNVEMSYTLPNLITMNRVIHTVEEWDLILREGKLPFDNYFQDLRIIRANYLAMKSFLLEMYGKRSSRFDRIG
jgi:hypothetical protein